MLHTPNTKETDRSASTQEGYRACYMEEKKGGEANSRKQGEVTGKNRGSRNLKYRQAVSAEGVFSGGV